MVYLVDVAVLLDQPICQDFRLYLNAEEMTIALLSLCSRVVSGSMDESCSRVVSGAMGEAMWQPAASGRSSRMRVGYLCSRSSISRTVLVNIII